MLTRSVATSSSTAISAASGVDLQPPCSGLRPEDLVIHGQLADLALAVSQAAIIRLEGLCLGPRAAGQDASLQAWSRCASTRSSRLSSSRLSPRSRRMTASAFLRAVKPDSLGAFSATADLPVPTDHLLR